METIATNFLVKKGKVSSNGQTLYWESHGTGEPLILVMGIGYDSSLWGLHQVPFFSQHFQTIIFDNRDVGQSSLANTSYAIKDMAEDMVGLMKELGIKKSHFIGISMGGMICQEFAINHPELVHKLILTGTSAANELASFDPINIWNFVKQNDKEGLTFAQQQFIWLFSDSFLRNHKAVEQTLQLLGSNPNPVSPAAYKRQVNAYLKHNTLNRLNKIKAPTLVLVGEQDRLTPPWIVKEVADGIPASKFRIIKGDGASHVLPLERPDDFNKAVFSFLNE